MDYKKIFRSQRLRFWILRQLSSLPDSVMLPLQYWIKMGRPLDLKHTRRFTEKIQLYKMLYRNELLFTIVDKYRVREYVEQRGLGHLLTTLYGIYDDPREIDIETLPSQFVIKTTDGSGGENILFCRNKESINWAESVAELLKWRNKKSLNAGREWAYTGIPKSRYIVEEYLYDTQSGDQGLIDYKLFCFGGRVCCIQIDYGRFSDHKRMILDGQFRPLDVKCTYDVGTPSECDGYLPSFEMVDLAMTLSEALPFVRVDLYRVNGRIYFGEMTLYPGSGYEAYEPDDFDFILGKEFDISTFITL
ncbi:MAG: ATP-grasp fold amidoligase family protein [Rikenellaceae bacterium]